MPRTKQTKPKKKANPMRFKGAALLLHEAGHSVPARQLHRAMGLK